MLRKEGEEQEDRTQKSEIETRKFVQNQTKKCRIQHGKTNKMKGNGEDIQVCPSTVYNSHRRHKCHSTKLASPSGQEQPDNSSLTSSEKETNRRAGSELIVPGPWFLTHGRGEPYKRQAHTYTVVPSSVSHKAQWAKIAPWADRHDMVFSFPVCLYLLQAISHSPSTITTPPLSSHHRHWTALDRDPGRTRICR